MARCLFCESPVTEAATQCPNCGAALAPADGLPARPADSNGGGAGESGWQSRMAELLSQGRKIEAIRQYQERTGAGLSEAKSAVEALERGEAHASRQTSPAAMASGEDAELLELLRQGQKIPAIKRYRERNSCDLRGAKEAVEALAARHGLSSRGAGCLGITALAIMVGVGVLISLR